MSSMQHRTAICFVPPLRNLLKISCQTAFIKFIGSFLAYPSSSMISMSFWLREDLPALSDVRACSLLTRCPALASPGQVPALSCFTDMWCRESSKPKLLALSAVTPILATTAARVVVRHGRVLVCLCLDGVIAVVVFQRTAKPLLSLQASTGPVSCVSSFKRPAAIILNGEDHAPFALSLSTMPVIWSIMGGWPSVAGSGSGTPHWTMTLRQFPPTGRSSGINATVFI